MQADVGFETVMELIDELKFEVQRKNIKDTAGIQSRSFLKNLLKFMKLVKKIYIALNIQENGLTVILLVGVNGVGKTTTIGKLAHQV